MRARKQRPAARKRAEAPNDIIAIRPIDFDHRSLIDLMVSTMETPSGANGFRNHPQYLQVGFL